MKNISLLLIALMCTLGVMSQKAVPLVSFSTLDTTLSVMEGQRWKDNQTGDSTSVVSYVRWNGDETTIISDTNEVKILALSARLFTPTGLGYTINADRIKSVIKVTDDSCLVFYERGNGVEIKIEFSALSVTEFIALVNAL